MFLFIHRLVNPFCHKVVTPHWCQPQYYLFPVTLDFMVSISVTGALFCVRILSQLEASLLLHWWIVSSSVVLLLGLLLFYYQKSF